MQINRLLQHQLSGYMSGENKIDAQFLELIQTVSQTYDYFEKKLSTTTADCSQADSNAEQGQACSFR